MLFGLVFAATSGTWYFALLSLGTPIIWLVSRRVSKSRQVEPDAPVIFDADGVSIGDFQLPRHQIFWKAEWNERVFAAYQAKDRKPEFDLQLRLAASGQHALIIGPTGSGKSQLIKLLLRQLITEDPNCRLWLYDFKGGASFNRFTELPQVCKLITDIDGHDAAAVWSQLELELATREAALAAIGAARIEEVAPSVMPRLYVLVDELAAALAESVQAHSALTALVARGRSLGVHFIGASQTLQGIPRAMLANIRARVALGEADPVDASLLNLKRPADTPIAPPGWTVGLVQNSGALSSYFFLPLEGSY